MIEITQDPTTSDRDRLELEPLFAIVETPSPEVDGTHVGHRSPRRAEYDHPVKYPPAVGLKFIALSRTQGQGPALDWLLRWALGAEGHAALLNATAMTDDECGEITGAVIDRALGRPTAPKSGS